MRICITGRKGSGKTTVINYLKRNYFNTFIVDEFIDFSYQKDQEANKAIQDELPEGIDVLDHFGNIDKQKLLVVFQQDPNLKKTIMKVLNELIHEAIEKLDDTQLWFVELGSYLTYEKVFKDLFDDVILIKCPKWKIQENINDYNPNHPGINQKEKIDADLVVWNLTTLDNFMNKIKKHLEKLLYE